MQSGGCSSEVQLPVDREEISEVPQLDHDVVLEGLHARNLLPATRAAPLSLRLRATARLFSTTFS
jgi:hypothetical protein